jgi:hypothetical protein
MRVTGITTRGHVKGNNNKSRGRLHAPNRELRRRDDAIVSPGHPLCSSIVPRARSLHRRRYRSIAGLLGSLFLSRSPAAPHADSSRCEGANSRFPHPFLIVYQSDCRFSPHVAEEPLGAKIRDAKRSSLQ